MLLSSCTKNLAYPTPCMRTDTCNHYLKAANNVKVIPLVKKTPSLSALCVTFTLNLILHAVLCFCLEHMPDRFPSAMEQDHTIYGT